MEEEFSFGNGITGKLIHDQDCEQPYQDDEAVRIVVLHGRYIDPAKGKCGRDPEEVAQWAKDNTREWFVTNLYMYEHSGVAYRAGEANPFGCPWDSGQVGIVAIKKSEWGKGKGELNAKRLQYCKDIAEEYGRWANGECYGYVIEDEDGEHLDSCFGFIGYEYAEQEMTAAAKHYVEEAGETAAMLADTENNHGAGI